MWSRHVTAHSARACTYSFTCSLSRDLTTKSSFFHSFNEKERGMGTKPRLHDRTRVYDDTTTCVYFLVSMARKSSFDLLEGAASAGFEDSLPPPASPPFVKPGAAAAPAAALAVPTDRRPAPLVDGALRSARGLMAALLRRPGNDKIPVRGETWRAGERHH